MSDKIKNYSNEYSILLGMLCVVVVYLHSSWVKGFDIYALWFDNNTLKSLSNLIIMSVVPSFFLIWGYLSNKYLYVTEHDNFSIKKKIFQFYPLYLISFLIHSILYKNTAVYNSTFIELLGGILGFYHKDGFYAGNIYVPVFYVLLTITILRKKRRPIYTKTINLLFTLAVLMISKIMPHESNLFYYKYFGYYASFFVGLTLKDYDFFDIFIQRKLLLFCLLLAGFLTPLLNYLGYYFVEIQYSPNSPEDILLTTSLTSLVLYMIKYQLLTNLPSVFLSFLNKIGNNAYFHFMIHAFVINAIIFTMSILNANKIFIQICVILFTSLITIYVVLPTYEKIISLAKLLRNKLATQFFYREGNS